MRVTAKMTDCSRAMERLHGILTGIASDNILEDKEIFELNNWLSLHKSFHLLHPFAGTVSLLKRCLEDGIIDEDEREDILDWCQRFENNRVPECVTTAIRRLHGVLHGIAIDKKVTNEELKGLRDWLYDYEAFKDHWPFNDTWQLVETILDDGIVTKEEEAEFLEYAESFIEIMKDDPKIHDEIYNRGFMRSEAPVLQPFTALCDRESAIEFQGKAFCFTGPARTGPRRKLEKIVKSLEGIPYKTVIKNLDYLVIGAQSSPVWVYSTYGRKIEKLIEWRDKGQEMTILHEDDFMAQASDRLPELDA